MHLTRRSLGLLSLVPAMAQCPVALGRTSPVRLIVGYTAGGPTDFVARLFQDPLSALWGQPVVIENRARRQRGACDRGRRPQRAGRLHAAAGDQRAEQQPGDLRQLPYDSIADFTPIALLYGSPTVLFVPKDRR